MHFMFYLMMFALKYYYVSAFEGATDGSSQGIPTFEVEIQGAFEVAVELLWNMPMGMRLLLQQSLIKESIKGELEDALYVALEGASKTSKSTKCCNKSAKKKAFGTKHKHFSRQLVTCIDSVNMQHIWIR